MADFPSAEDGWVWVNFQGGDLIKDQIATSDADAEPVINLLGERHAGKFIDHSLSGLFCRLLDYESDGNDTVLSDSFNDSALNLETAVSRAKDVQKATDYTNTIIQQRANMTVEEIFKQHGLPFLPAKSLTRFRTVCTDWDRFIRLPLFAHRQTNSFRALSGFFHDPLHGPISFIPLDRSAHGVPSPNLNFLPIPVHIVSSSNGLLCLQGMTDDQSTYYICNPTNRTWVCLPKPQLYHGDKPLVVLAFDPSPLHFSPDYKLVAAVCVHDSPLVRFEVYSSLTGAWRVSEAECYEGASLRLKGGAFYLNGVVYWDTWSGGQVLAFDTREEWCGVVPLPPGGCHGGVLGENNGELAYVSAYDNSDGDRFTIDTWRVQGLEMLWRVEMTPEFVGDVGCNFKPLPCLDMNVLLVLVRDRAMAFHFGEEKIVELGKDVEFNGRRCWPYVNSLVQL